MKQVWDVLRYEGGQKFMSVIVAVNCLFLSTLSFNMSLFGEKSFETSRLTIQNSLIFSSETNTLMVVHLEDMIVMWPADLDHQIYPHFTKMEWW